MRRVVITGLGLTSCIGSDQKTVNNSLRNLESGIRFNQEFKDLGFRSQVSGCIEFDPFKEIERKKARFMSDAAAHAYISMRDAIADSGLENENVSNPKTGIIMGSGGTSSKNVLECSNITLTKGVRRVGPYRVTQIMSSTVSACLATPFQIKGVNYSITSACATSLHCIGNGVELIQNGKQDIVFAGGGEELHWNMAAAFDAMGALSSKHNQTPKSASRAYDQDRDGFVISYGGGCVVLEEYEHAKARGAKIYAEVIGYGATSDGADMVAPSGEGAERCMKMALQDVEGEIDYVNTHGTSTPVGDVAELRALENTFKGQKVPMSSTKSLTGHSLGSAGVHETIFCLLMMQDNYVCGSANISNLDENASNSFVARETFDKPLKNVLTNSFGFGGTNASLVFHKV